MDDSVTLGVARQWLRDRFKEKIVACPCCKQSVKLYKRNITSAMAVGLIRIYREDQVTKDWIHHPTLLKTSALCGDFAKLAYWGLIVHKPGVRDDGSVRTGWHRITPDGRLFVERKLRVRKYKYIYNSQCVSVDGADMTDCDIVDALGDNFNYLELMTATPDGSDPPQSCFTH